MRTFTLILATTASMMLGGAAIAQTSPEKGMSGDTSGTAAGGNVTPSTAVQKNGRSSSEMQQHSPAAGSPGVEGPAGSENGPAPTKSGNDMK